MMFIMASRNGRSKYMVYWKADFASCQFEEITEEEYKHRVRNRQDSQREDVVGPVSTGALKVQLLSAGAWFS